jgi:hypothetical protein
MKDQDKTKEQLITELTALRKRLTQKNNSWNEELDLKKARFSMEGA